MRLYLQERPVTPLYLAVDVRKSDDGEKIPGMEGPFTFRGGRTLHYDPKEGKYYDRGKDMYLDHDEASDATSSYSREENERSKAKERSGGGATQTGPRGGSYTMSASGKKVYKGVDLYLDLSKAGGEGSRGGKVTGHTKSGRAIYQTCEHCESNFKTAPGEAIPAHNTRNKASNWEPTPCPGAGDPTSKAIDLYLDLAKGGEGSRGGKVIGHTKSGKPVYESSRGAPDTNNVDTFTRVKGKFPGWSKQDHMDAAKVHDDHAEANQGTKVGRNSRGWSSVHWDVGGRWTSGEFDAHHAQKGNPHRDPSVGHFISGGAGKAMNGKGQQDMDEFMNSLMDKLPGEEMDKT